MFSSQLKMIFFFFAAILFFSGNSLAQVSSSASQRADTSISSVHDTITVKADTLYGQPDSNTAREKDTLDIITSTESLNTIPGFRVQINSTQDISEALDERSKAENLLSDYNVYIIYDSPYYKVRAGDFRARYDAAQVANFISSHGFPGAWVVPDNVFKEPVKKSK